MDTAQKKDENPRDYLGRGNTSIAGKPFGYAHHMERLAICEHIVKRKPTDSDMTIHMFRITKIQERIHKYEPSFRERQQLRGVIKRPPVTFSLEQLQHMVDLFSFANDEISRSIANTAQSIIDRES